MKPLAVAFLAIALFAAGGAAPASADIELRSQTVQNVFPDGLKFTALVTSTANVSRVQLNYRILPDGVNSAARATCTTGTPLNCTAIIGQASQVYLVPGAEVIYYWSIEDANGGTYKSDEAHVTFNDDRFKWESQVDGNLTVYSYFGNDASVQNVIKAARETIEKFSKLEKTQIDFPLKIWVYASARDMSPAVASRQTNGPSGSISTLGEVSASDTALVSRDTDFLNIVRHEVAHIVTRRATRGFLVEIPTWINEGLSTYAQTQMLPNEQQALEIAIRSNRVLPITSLGVSSRSTPDTVSIFYAQSGSIVAYLIQTYGEDKFGTFIQSMKNDTMEVALKAVYGFDTLGLENNWRKAVGLPPVGSGSGNNPSSAPTLPPLSQGGQPSSASASDDSGGDGMTMILLGLIAAAGVCLIGGAGYYLYRNRDATPPPA